MCLLLGFGIHWKVMGRGEIDLIVSRLRSLRNRGAPKPSDSTFVQIQGKRNWQATWSMILDFTNRNEIDSVEISASLPRLREAFSGRHGNTQMLGSRACWRLSIPLRVDGTECGWIKFAGKRRRRVGRDDPTLFEFVRRLEAELDKIAKANSAPISMKPILSLSLPNLSSSSTEGMTVR